MYAAQPNPRLSPTEAQILEAFLNPEATFLAVAKSLSLNLQELLDALTSPAISAALDTLSQLDAIRRRLSLAPIVPGALNALTRLLDKGENLTEVRRAATTILNTYTRLERTQHRPLFQRSSAENNAAEMERYRAILAEREASRSSETRHAARITQPGSGADSGLRTKDSGPAPGDPVVTRPAATPIPIGPIGPIGPIPARADAQSAPPVAPPPPPHVNGSAPSASSVARHPARSTQHDPLSPAHLLTCSPAQVTPAALAAAAGHAISVYALIPQPARAPPLCPPASLARHGRRPPLAHAA